MNLLSERLAWAMEEERSRRQGKRVTKAELARVAGVSDTAVGNWLKGDHGIDAVNARQIAEHLRVDPLWLETGRGSATSNVAFDENVSPSPMGVRPIPVISSVQAGALRDMESPYPPGSGYAVEYADEGLSRWAFALEVEGDSMMPAYRPGDRIIVDPELAPNPGDLVVARNGSVQATFKKYRPRGIDSNGEMIFELVPLNEDYPTLRSDTERLVVIGVVTEHRKKLRRT